MPEIQAAVFALVHLFGIARSPSHPLSSLPPSNLPPVEAIVASSDADKCCDLWGESEGYVDASHRYKSETMRETWAEIAETTGVVAVPDAIAQLCRSNEDAPFHVRAWRLRYE